MKNNFITPASSLPQIHIATTTRDCGDMRHNENREKVKLSLGLPHINWLTQVHGKDCISLTNNTHISPNADAYVTTEKNRACAVMTADCLPVVLYSKNKIAVIHAGWRGIYAGILEEALSQLQCEADELHAWFGPAISANHYEVDLEFKDRFLKQDPSLENAFSNDDTSQKPHCSLVSLAQTKLKNAGILASRISGGEYCTYRDKHLFYSHRREKEQSGRIATIVWLG